MRAQKARRAIASVRPLHTLVSFKADILAEVPLLPTESGGRPSPAPEDKFGCPVGIGSEFFDIRIDLSRHGEFVAWSDRTRAGGVLRPDFVLPLLHVGSEFMLWEARTIGHGRVIEIYDLFSALELYLARYANVMTITDI
jgi:hypothetical protein